MITLTESLFGKLVWWKKETEKLRNYENSKLKKLTADDFEYHKIKSNEATYDEHVKEYNRLRISVMNCETTNLAPVLASLIFWLG